MSENLMRIGIDLHNIRDGGGINYITNLLLVADPQEHKFESIHLFASPSVLSKIPKTPFIIHHPQSILERCLYHRILWSTLILPRLLRQNNCDILYAPGGVVPSALLGFGLGLKCPFVTISRNMMPFSPQLWRLYPRGSDRMRLKLLYRVHLKAFKAADAMIYLTKSAYNTIEPLVSSVIRSRTVHIIPHGVNHSLFKPQNKLLMPKPDSKQVIKIVYCSRLEPYKHQIEVIEAIACLWPYYPNLHLTMIGWANKTYESKVRRLMTLLDPDGTAIKYLGPIPNTDLPKLYAKSHLKVFASACENLPNTLIESLGVGIPVLSSLDAPMPEVAGNSCLYFNPKDPSDIAQKIDQALIDWNETQHRVQLGIIKASEFTWQHCATETFNVLNKVFLRYLD
jgi:glycosyltransferase involved in cell wall biosynthesis